ncbi:MAG: GAK system ATP-grasp enzyme [Candidatus Thiodiazotropha sp.]
MASSRARIGVVGTPGKWSTEALADAVEAATGFRLVIDMGEVCAELDTGVLRYHDWKLSELDAVVVKKISEVYSPATLDRLEMLRMLEKAGVRVFSQASRIQPLIDRLSGTMALYKAGIPMPPTRVTESRAAAMSAVWDFESAVFKPLYSTKARGMTLIDTHDGPASMQQAIEAFHRNNPVMYIQQRLQLPGQDLGMVFLGGDYLGTYARVGRAGAWNTTILSGGHYQRHEAGDELIALAQRAQAVFGLDFTTVDVAETEQGPVVFEVSAFGGFHGALKGIGINVAERYVDYMLKALA